jgi:hypothetical protein
VDQGRATEAVQSQINAIMQNPAAIEAEGAIPEVDPATAVMVITPFVTEFRRTLIGAALQELLRMYEEQGKTQAEPQAAPEMQQPGPQGALQ